MEAEEVARLQKEREEKVVEHLYHSCKRVIAAHIRNSVMKDVIYILPDHVNLTLITSEDSKLFYSNLLVRRLSSEGFFVRKVKTQIGKYAIYINWLQSYRNSGGKDFQDP